MGHLPPPPETFLGVERKEVSPGQWYYHIGSPDPWALVFVYSRVPFGQTQDHYDVSVEFRLIGSRAHDQNPWSRRGCKDIDAAMTELALEIEARLITVKREIDRGLEAIRNHEPVKRLDFWTRLVG